MVNHWSAVFSASETSTTLPPRVLYNILAMLTCAHYCGCFEPTNYPSYFQSMLR